MVVHVLVIISLAALHFVAHAAPPEALHVPGLHDGGDYDSIILPQVLALSGLPEGPVPRFALLLRPVPGRLETAHFGRRPERAPSLVQPRGPPTP